MVDRADLGVEGSPVPVRGRALGVAVGVTLVLLVGALWAAKVDYDSPIERNTVPFDVLSAVYKAAIVAGLLVVGRRLQSRSIRLLAGLVAALGVGSLFVNSSLSDTLIDPLAEFVADSLPVSDRFVYFGVIFVGLAVVGGWLVLMAYKSARDFERRTVVIIIVMLFVVGVFVGPINAISVQGYNREWLFAEDFGQVVSLALLTGYTSGLLVATSEQP